MTPHQHRLERVRAAMRRWGVDLMFLGYGPDLTYVTGLLAPMYYPILKSEGDWITGLLFGLEQAPVLIVHEHFAVDLAAPAWLDDVRVLADGEDGDAFLAGIVAEFKPQSNTIAVNKMIWGQSLLSLQAAAPDARFITATNAMMDEVRVVKDEDELQIMRRAAEITDQAMAATQANLKLGMTERDVAIEVDYQLRRHGGDGPSFYPGIICVGNNSDPQRHIFTRNTDMVLAPGTTVAFDFGTLYNGYCSDFGRSAFIGDPRPEALAAYRSITSAVQATMKVMAAGQITPAQIADFTRDLIAADGFGEWYMYLGLGHSIGLEVHESPWLRPGFTEPIRANMCFTLEPKIWKPGEFYVRCEDMVVVGEDGAVSLNTSPYEPIVID